MRVEDEILYLDEKLEFDDCEAILSKIDDVNEVVVQTNDIHPSVMQLLFCINESKNVTVEDEFNKRFFENVRFVL